MKKAEIQVVVLKNEIVTSSTCLCYEFGVVNDAATDEC